MKTFLLCSVAMLAFVSSDIARAAGATPDEILARIEAIEKENALLRKEVADLRRDKEKGVKPTSAKLPASVAFQPHRQVTTDRMGNAQASKAQAYSEPVEPRDNWSGVYWGASFGVGGGRSTVTSHQILNQTFQGGQTLAETIDNVGNPTNTPGGLVDVFLGANKTLGEHFVVGGQIEGTISDMNFGSSGSGNMSTVQTGGGQNSTGSGSFQTSIHSRWMASALARGGFLFDQTTLLYGLAGWTVAQFDAQVVSPNYVNNTFPVFNDRFIASGPTVGGGIEKKLNPNWSVRAEYRYTHFGTKTVSDSMSQVTTNPWLTTQAQQTSYKSDMQVGRVGIAYSIPVGR